MSNIVTSPCPVNDCPFMGVEDQPRENPEGAAKDVAEHIRDEHDPSELPDEDISDLVNGESA